MAEPEELFPVCSGGCSGILGGFVGLLSPSEPKFSEELIVGDGAWNIKVK